MTLQKPSKLRRITGQVVQSLSTQGCRPLARWLKRSGCLLAPWIALGMGTAGAWGGPVALWTMKPTGLSTPCVLDGHIDEGVHNLWASNNNGNALAASSDIPPAKMRSRADDSGVSYDASALASVDGALLYSPAAYGDVFKFTDAFTVELFFKTHGDKSASGPMEVLLQGQTTLRFALTVNEPAAGHVRFTIRDAAGQQQFCDLIARNYADGQWHYLRATYEPAAGVPGRLALSALNENSSWDATTTVLPQTFQGLAAGSDGNLHIGRNTYSKNQAPRTFLGLIDEVQISAGIASGTNLLCAQPGALARWSMTPAGGHFPAVLDTLTGDGAQHLITFNGLGDQYPVSSDVPPAALMANGHSGGAHSFNAAAFTNVAGALFYPQDVYGNAFSFGGGFAVELFFKTDGNRAGAGLMELVMQGETSFRFGLIVNEPGPGNVRFAINDTQGHIPVADLVERNYADGQWHYLLAKYVPSAASNGVLVLTIANTDRSVQSAVTCINAAFLGLAGGNDGNLFVGRNVFALGPNARTFLGLIDEVQISSGAPATGSQRLGAMPPPAIATVRRNPNSLTVNWTAQPGETYAIEYTENLEGDPPRWLLLETRSAWAGPQTFTETNPARLDAPVGFYRISLK